MSAQTHTTHSAGTARYILGFILSFVLTLLSFGAVMLHWMAGWSISSIVIFLLGLAAIQMMVQIIFFLHLDEGPDARWNIISMWVSVFCVIIIIAGTWLTMQHLNYNMIGGSGRVIRNDIIYHPSTPQSPVFQEMDADKVPVLPDL